MPPLVVVERGGHLKVPQDPPDVGSAMATSHGRLIGRKPLLNGVAHVRNENCAKKALEARRHLQRPLARRKAGFRLLGDPDEQVGVFPEDGPYCLNRITGCVAGLSKERDHEA